MALIEPLAWEPPYAAGVALKRPKKINNSSFLQEHNLTKKSKAFKNDRLTWVKFYSLRIYNEEWMLKVKTSAMVMGIFMKIPHSIQVLRND